MVFIDTSAFLPIIDAAEQRHAQARGIWEQLIGQGRQLFTSNYVMIETTALLQHRLGMAAVRLYQQDILHIVGTLWIDGALHAATVAALLAANRRQLSLVDCSSFETMRRHGITTAFAFDAHFQEQGFTVL